jgi:hypothetical protein
VGLGHDTRQAGKLLNFRGRRQRCVVAKPGGYCGSSSKDLPPKKSPPRFYPYVNTYFAEKGKNDDLFFIGFFS